MLQEMSKAIIGQRRVLREMLAAVFCRAHCLLVGVPGLAKTLMVRALADVLALKFKRIQFTPDLMPSDITGTNVLEDADGKRRFEFLRGPIFAHVILADEINRTPPKTQAALLEAMQERQVSVGDQTYLLEEPFFVIATQNPIEQEGTYPLPEAQLDRFMFNIHVDYPNAEEEEEIIRYITLGTYPRLRAVLSREDILALQEIVGRVMVSDHVIRYASRLVRTTRPKGEEAPKFIRQFVDWGAGPRAGQALIMGGRAMAMIDGRPNVSCDDVRDVAVPVLRHRMAPNFQAQAEGIDSVELIRRLLKEVPEPRVEAS
ncbi:MAG: AAA family ATPase [Candidatus Brocadiae bacterium]|nr:AAA family ATPase [Candidatus Brocadiia bacterium]